MARGDFIEKRGSAVITDSLTYVGAGGIDLASVDGLPIGPFVFAGTSDATATLQAGIPGHATITDYPVAEAGSIVGVALVLKTKLGTSDNHVSATVFNGTTSTGFAATANTTTSLVATATQAKDTDTVAAGDRINLKITSGTAGLTTFSFLAVVYAER